MSFFISDAMAEAAATAGPETVQGPNPLIMLGIFGVIFYFLLWRPQSKRQKEQRELISSISKGDEVTTTGGIAGKITKVSEDTDFILVEVTKGVEMKFSKGSVANILPKGTLKAI